MGDGGKGSGRRPGAGYGEAWDRIFAKDRYEKEKQLQTKTNPDRPDGVGHVRHEELEERGRGSREAED